jgi:O-antigen/teichoic acid export membrane protein
LLLKIDKFFKDSALVAGIKIFQALAGLATAWIITNLISTEIYGQYAFIISALMILGLLAKSGFKGLSTYKLASLIEKQNSTEKKTFSLFACSIPLFTCSVITIVLYFIYYFTGDSNLLILLLGSPILFLLCLLEICSGLLSGQKRVVVGQFLEFVLRPVTFLILIISLVLTTYSIDDVLTLIQIQIVALLICVFVAFWLNRNLLDVNAIKNLNLENCYGWVRQAIPYLMSNSGVVIYQQLGVLFAGWYLTNEMTAAYRIADQISTLLAFGLHALNSAISPHVASAKVTDNMVKIQSVITRLTWVLALGVTLVFIGFMFFADELMALFSLTGSTYVTCFVVLCIGQLFNVFCGTNGMVLNMTGNAKFNAKWSYIAVAVNLTLLFILTPLFGLLGIASSMAISRCFWNISLVIEAKKRTGLNTTIIPGL